MVTDLLAQWYLHELFEYRGGVLVWRVQTSSRALVGVVAGAHNSCGYCHIRIVGRTYLRHRLIFLMHHGYMPKETDHINRIKGDDRIENLREVTSFQNFRNTKKYDNAKGYCWEKSCGKWKACIKVNWKNIHLGYYDTEAEARAAYLNARVVYHGDAA